MELGLSLDDEDLGQTRNRTSAQTLTSFNAKVCTPLWFQSEVSSTDVTVSENNSQLLKFNGDYQYHSGRYDAASELYLRSLAVLPNHSQATRLDLRQSLARCYLQLGRVQEAKDLSQCLVNNAQNIDQEKQSFLLKLEVALAVKRWEEAESCLHFLIGLQPHFTHFWLQLAQVCHQMEPHGDVGHDSKLITCYIRAKLLLQSTMSAVSEVIRRRDEVLLLEVERKLEELQVSDAVFELASEFLRFDLKQERGQGPRGDRRSDDNNDTDAGSNDTDSTSPKFPEDSPNAFYSHWCGWTKLKRPSAAPVDT